MQDCGITCKTPGASRRIRFIAEGVLAPELSLPVAGRVAAGKLILAIELDLRNDTPAIEGLGVGVLRGQL